MKEYNASRFKGKVALITGGASGIGRATAQRLATEGAQVIIADRDTERGQQAVSDINENGGSAFFVEVDLADEGSIERLGVKVSEQFPALHVLVNGAVGPGGGRIETGDWRANWGLGTAVSLKAAALIAQVLLPLMKKEGGSIINISSDGAVRGRANIWIYDAMKAALISLSKTMACARVWDSGQRPSTRVDGDRDAFWQTPGPGGAEARAGDDGLGLLPDETASPSGRNRRRYRLLGQRRRLLCRRHDAVRGRRSRRVGSVAGTGGTGMDASFTRPGSTVSAPARRR